MLRFASNALGCGCAGRSGRAWRRLEEGPSKVEPPVEKFSALYIVALSSFAFPVGLFFASMGLVIIPAEAGRLWPEAQATSLGGLLAVTGVTQLISPAAGLVSDRCTNWLGRRRPYLLGGSAVGILGMVAMRVASGHLWRGAYAAALCASMLGLNVAYAGFTGLVADLLPPSTMGRASGSIAVLNAAGAALSFYLFGFAGVPVRHAYAIYILGTAAAAALTLAVAHETPLASAPRCSLREMAGCYRISLATHGDFYWVFWIRVLYYMGVSVLSFMMLFLRDVVLPQTAGAPLLSEGVPPHRWPLYYTSMISLVGQGGAMCAALTVGRLSDVHGRKPYLRFAVCAMCAVFGTFMCSPPLEVTLAVGALFGVGNGAFLAVDYALAVDTLPDKKNAAKDLGIWGVSAFVGSALGPAVIGGRHVTAV